MNQPDYLERKAAALIAAARSSRWKQEIFEDADELRELGYAPDVALAIALRYWEGDPATGELRLPEVLDQQPAKIG